MSAPENDGRVDRHDGYVTYPTPTGTLPLCLTCGALVGDTDQHDNWHADQALLASPRAIVARLRALKRRNGGQHLGLS